MEDVKGLHLLTCADKLDRLSDYCLDRECGTTAGVTVHLGEDNAVEIEAVVECFSGLYCVLSCHCIDNEECLCRIDSLVECRNLVHEFLIHCQTTCCIDDYY